MGLNYCQGEVELQIPASPRNLVPMWLGYGRQSCSCWGWWAPCLIPGRPVLNSVDTASCPPEHLRVHLMDLMFTVPCLTTSQLPFFPSAFYFPCTVLWLNSWMPGFLNELSVSWSSICLQVVNCNFDHSWILFHTAALPVVWTGPQWFSAPPPLPPLFFSLTS